MFAGRRRRALITIVATTATVAAGLVTAVSAQAATGCQVAYQAGSSWPGGFTANITITNLGDPINGWRLGWSFTAGQAVTQSWGFTANPASGNVVATNASYNASIPTNGSVGAGFNGSWNNSSNPAPTSFTLNGTVCTGSTTGPTGGATTAPTTRATTAPTSRATTPPTTGGPSQPQTGLVGWATQGGGTSGGGSAGSTTVTSASALTTAMAGTNAAVIRVSGTISCSGMLRVGSNKTILGNSGATISGCGLNVASASNVIIRNLNFTGWDDDAINVQYSTRVWIDHNSFSNGYDGAVDIKRASDYVTVSWNRVFNHDKNMLLGHSDDNAGEDVGHLRVTYHHNWFDGTNQRNPRVRFGNPVHVYNNYYGNVGSYGVASTMNAGVLVEGNYFENTDDTYHLGEGSSGAGSLVARNNHFVNSPAGQTGGSVAGIPYSYQLDTASGVKASVTSGAGAGRISV